MISEALKETVYNLIREYNFALDSINVADKLSSFPIEDIYQAIDELVEDERIIWDRNMESLCVVESLVKVKV